MSPTPEFWRQLARETIIATIADGFGYPSVADVDPSELAPMENEADRILAALTQQHFALFARVFAEPLAQEFHETYEALAPDFGYRTREASAKPWAEVPDQNRGLMVAVCQRILEKRASEQEPQRQDGLREQLESVKYLAVKAGCYDAADAISGLLGRPVLRSAGDGPAVDLAVWLTSLDDPEDPKGLEERRTVTLTQIIDKARAALRKVRGE
jgi:hypothetical protein